MAKRLTPIQAATLEAAGVPATPEQIDGTPITPAARGTSRSIQEIAADPGVTTEMKVFTPFTADDKVLNMSRRVTAGMWTGNTGSLYTFFTSSVQSASSGYWYYDIYNSAASTGEVQFALAYGHKDGGGYPVISALNTSKEPTKAIYAQYRNILLDPEDETFSFANSWDSDHIFVLNIQRSRLKQKMDAGNWELHIVSGSSPAVQKTIKLIDDSGQKFDQAVSLGGRKYNVVSGSLNVGAAATIKTTAANEPAGGMGLFYPDRGFIVLNPHALEYHLGRFISSGSATTAIANNHGKLYKMIESGSYFTARNEEIVTSAHYFVRVKNKEYNLSNNPTYYTSSDGSLNVSTFIGDPHSYITTIGLYNDSNELLAVAKVSTPLLKSFDREALIKVKLDY